VVVTYDRYHLATHAGKAVDGAPRRGQAAARAQGDPLRVAEAPEHLTAKQAAALDALRPAAVGLATARAYRWRPAFDAFFDQPASWPRPT
jgi:hypothetical protein